MGETLTVRINDCLSFEGQMWWYKNQPGSVFRVERDPVDPMKYFVLTRNNRKHQIRCCDCKIVSLEEEKRRNASIRALLKAKECLELERMYLSVKKPTPMDELYKVHDSIDHVVNSLNRLTLVEEVKTS